MQTTPYPLFPSYGFPSPCEDPKQYQYNRQQFHLNLRQYSDHSGAPPGVVGGADLSPPVGAVPSVNSFTEADSTETCGVRDRHTRLSKRHDASEEGTTRTRGLPFAVSAPSFIQQQQQHFNGQVVPGEKVDKDGGEKEIFEWDQFTNAEAAFLGPQLWEKTIPCDPDLKLEYMDLDEFLSENNIDDEILKRNLSVDGGLGGLSPPKGDSSSPEPPLVAKPLPFLPSPTSPVMGSAENSSSSSISSPRCSSGGRKEVISPSPRGDTRTRATDSIPSPISSSRSVRCPSESPLTPSSPTPSEDLHGEDFDPRTRAFSEDELKPQPMIKKSRKQQYVPHELKDDRYWARRKKNNVAAKRSRDARRTKENQIAMRANFLEKENQTLRQELEKTRSMLEAMKERLAVYETP